MRKEIKHYIEQFNSTFNFDGIGWWIIDYENDPDHYYCNETMIEVFSLDKSLEKHSVGLTCPIAGDYNKNIDLATSVQEKSKIVFNQYAQLIAQERSEYKNKFPYYNQNLNKTFYFSSRAKVLEKNEKNEISILYGIIEDITASELQEKELKENSEIIDEFIMITETTLKGIITKVTKAFCKLSGYTQEELIGSSHNIIRHSSTPIEVYEDMWSTITSAKVWKGELNNKKKNGEDFWVYSIISPKFDDNENITGYTSIKFDITDKKTIEVLSQKDKLTNLYNRVKIDTSLNQEIERAQRYHLDLAIIMLDIDHFKSINDTYGHIVGDKTLRKFADLLQSNVRKIDVLGRWGGEEFIVICQNTNIKTAQILAEKLRLIIQNYKFDTSGKQTASFGIAQYKKEDSPETLIIRADNALYKAKNDGRNRVEFYD